MTVQARILIVDDEQPLVDLLTQAFRQEGHRVMTANNGIDCMNRMASFRPDVVIMDIMMPKLDGIDTTRLIRRNRSYAGTAIIALSAKSDETTRAKMKEAGASLFMRKPFAVGKLVERVGRLLAPQSGTV